MMRTDLELLAPAGKWDVLERVVQSGADAVYAGGKRFNMRMLRPDFNFSDHQLKDAAAYLHDCGKRLYITLNNLYGEDDLSELKDYLYYLQQVEVDALIVQDLGVAALHRELNLQVPLHASVQMGIGNVSAVKLLETLGFSRVILSKNLSLEEIDSICRETHLGIEFFAHGDLCISHTGQCWMSSLLTGESGNRGRCVKPCRWQYRLESRGRLQGPGYYLAHNDLCVYPYLQDLVQAGVQSFKIEGRMRGADYLSSLVAVYRRALDGIIQDPDRYETSMDDMRTLEGMRIRDFSSASLHSPPDIRSIGLDGSREPKFPTAPVRVKQLTEDDFQPFEGDGQQVPQLIVKVGDLDNLAPLQDYPLDFLVLGWERYRQENREWWWPKLVEAMEFCARHQLPFVVETPRIVLQHNLSTMEQIMDRLDAYPLQAVMVNDWGSLRIARLQGFNVYGGAGLNVSNSEAGRILLEHEVTRLTLSPESSFSDLLSLTDAGLPVDVVVHGPQCGIVTDLCLFRAAQEDQESACQVDCQQSVSFLWDELGQRYAVRSDEQCRNYIFSPMDLCLYHFLPLLAKAGTAGIRIEGQYSQAQELAETVGVYREGLSQLARGQWRKDQFERLLAMFPQGLTPGWFAGKYSI